MPHLPRPALLAAALGCALAAPAQAQAFETVTDKAAFVQLIDGRQLTRLGIRLAVSPAGGIQGKAFGMAVKGAWSWQGGYFCRDLAYGDTALPYNCQQVLVKGNTLRFIADKGKGDRADLTLR